MEDTHREVHNCKSGEKNPNTGEIFCNKYNEFCKFIAYNECKEK